VPKPIAGMVAPFAVTESVMVCLLFLPGGNLARRCPAGKR
jgi:hypothetical protein